MRKLGVFNNVTLDGYFTDAQGSMEWAKGGWDPEWGEFAAGNARGGGALLFGRVTYEMMAGFWTTPEAAKQMPEVAAGMNRMQKFVASRSLTKVSWANTTLLKGDLVEAVRKLKQEPGPDLCILGSGTLVAQLTAAGLIDEYQLAVVPVVLGKGRTLFEGLPKPQRLKLTDHRAFRNGNVVLTYTSA